MHINFTLGSIGTHNTYHTQHKEVPLLCYTVPQVPLPYIALQGGHRKVQASKTLEILAYSGFINKFQPLNSLPLQSSLGFFPNLAT